MEKGCEVERWRGVAERECCENLPATEPEGKARTAALLWESWRRDADLLVYLAGSGSQPAACGDLQPVSLTVVEKKYLRARRGLVLG